VQIYSEKEDITILTTMEDLVSMNLNDDFLHDLQNQEPFKS